MFMTFELEYDKTFGNMWLCIVSVKIYVPYFSILLFSHHDVYDHFVRLTLCPSIHLMNGSWLQHLVMELLSYLTCENYQEACMLSTTMSMYYYYFCLLTYLLQSVLLFFFVETTLCFLLVSLPATLQLCCYAATHLMLLCCAICTCRGEVFQVEWNPNLETVLASHAADKRVMIWDVSR